MSFDLNERGRESSAPIELYEFGIGPERFRYTTAPGPVTYASNVYLPLAIKREALFFGADQRGEALKITMPASNELVRRYINGVPGLLCSLRIERAQRFDGTSTRVIQFDGVVKSVAFTLDGIQAELAVLPLSGELNSVIPRFVYSSQCNHVLFDENCQVLSSLHRFLGPVASVTNDILTVTGLSARGSGWATGGFVATTGGDYRLIIDHTGDNIRLLLPFYTSPIGQNVEVFAGCDHTLNHCGPKFSNTINFGGYPFVPSKNVFQTGI